MENQPEIEWSNETFNIVWGCAKVSPACDNCHAEARTAQDDDRANESSVSESQLGNPSVSS
jgi:protein gp37